MSGFSIVLRVKERKTIVKKLVEDSIEFILSEKKDKQKSKELHRSIKSRSDEQKFHLIKEAILNSDQSRFNNSEQDFKKVVSKLNRNRSVNFVRYVAVASIAILVLFGISKIEFEIVSEPIPTIAKDRFLLYRTGEKEQIQLNLKDGTRILLSPKSELKIPTDFSVKNREVFVKGQAYFEVYHNGVANFVVHSGDYQVRVLGTKFRIHSFDNENYISTTLKEGKVEVDITGLVGKSKQHTLKPKQKLIYDKAKRKAFIRNFNQNIDFSYIKKSVIFKNQTFKNIVKNLALFYNRKIEINYPEIENYKYSGEYRNEKITDVLESLRIITDFEIVNSGRKITIKQKEISEKNKKANEEILN